MNDKSLVFNRKKIITFIVLTFAISWTIFIPAISRLKGVYDINNPTLSLPLLLGSFGPTAAAIATQLMFSGLAATLQWLKCSFKIKIGRKLFFCITLLLPLLTFIGNCFTTTSYNIELYKIFFTMVAAMPLNFLSGIFGGRGTIG